MPDNLNRVHMTKDYGEFKNLFANRNINKRHVNELITSFQDRPNLVPTRPILVNEKMEVIDGQHRLEACKILGLPVYYTIAADLNIKDAQLMNALQRGWSVLDYARSFASSGNSNYRRFLELHEEYPISVSILMSYCIGREQSNTGKLFRKGEFKVMKSEELLRQRLDMLADYGTRFNGWTNHNFCRAVHAAIRTPEYDHDRMMRKLKIYQIKKQSSRLDYLRELENAYNFHEPEANHLRFF